MYSPDVLPCFCAVVCRSADPAAARSRPQAQLVELSVMYRAGAQHRMHLCKPVAPILFWSCDVLLMLVTWMLVTCWPYQLGVHSSSINFDGGLVKLDLQGPGVVVFEDSPEQRKKMNYKKNDVGTYFCTRMAGAGDCGGSLGEARAKWALI